jgi:hypothetical protein
MQHNKPRSWVREFLTFFVETEQELRIFSLTMRRRRGGKKRTGARTPFPHTVHSFSYVLQFYYRILSHFSFRATFPPPFIFSATCNIYFLSISFCCSHAFFFDDCYHFLLYILFYSLDSPAKVLNSSRVFLSKFFKLLFFGANHIVMKLSLNIIAKVRNFVLFCLTSMI